MSVAELYDASRFGRYGMARRLLHEGVNPNVPRKWSNPEWKGLSTGWVLKETWTTPLHAAARVGDARMIHLLQEYGVDPDVQDSDGRTADEVAVNEDIRDLIKPPPDV